MLDFARNAGVDTVQELFFSEPVPAAQVERLALTWPSCGPASTGSWRASKPLDFEACMTTHRSITPRSKQGTTL